MYFYVYNPPRSCGGDISGLALLTLGPSTLDYYDGNFRLNIIIIDELLDHNIFLDEIAQRRISQVSKRIQPCGL
jgi:hypothetical protein